MLGELFPFIIIVCAVVIIWSLVNKNKKLQKTALQNINNSKLSLAVTNMIHSGKGQGYFFPLLLQKIRV